MYTTCKVNFTDSLYKDQCTKEEVLSNESSTTEEEYPTFSRACDGVK